MDPTGASFPPGYLAENRSSETTNVTIVFGVLEVLFVGLFFLSKYKNKTIKGWDVYMMLPAFLMCFSTIIVNILLVKYAGLGRHMILLSPKESKTWLKLFVTMQFTYVPSVTFPKLSVLALYLRIFTGKAYRYAVYAVAVFLGLVWLTSFVLAFRECKPFPFSWDKTIPNGYCIDLLKPFRLIGGLNLLSDVAMLILPLPVIWHLHTSTNQKIGLTITFLTGSLGIVTAILRFVVFFKTDFFVDLTWYSVELTVWTTAESGLYLIAACLPSLRPLFKHIDISALRSSLLGYSNKMFSKHSDGKGTLPTSSGRANRNVSNNRMAGVSFEHLHGNKSPTSSGYKHIEQGLVHSGQYEGVQSDHKMASLDKSLK